MEKFDYNVHQTLESNLLSSFKNKENKANLMYNTPPSLHKYHSRLFKNKLLEILVKR